MAAYPIDWHEQCLRQSMRHLACERYTLNKLNEYVQLLERDIERYQKQIARAKSLRKTKFDRERFGE